MAGYKFTVDTHLFRELGQLLVGRDSTALVELIKNSYDADAEKVIVLGQDLNDEELGRITITDDGVGMGEEQFTEGFLRIASRLKDGGERRSKRFQRRYTGAKGIGRLAAHKLAKFIHIGSIPAIDVFGPDARSVTADIDWDLVEAKQTLDDLEGSGAITVKAEEHPAGAKSGTVIELHKLRGRWTPAERARFFAEVQTFSPPRVLVDPPLSVVSRNGLLFERPLINDSRPSDPGFSVELAGELEAGEDYWQSLAQAAQWVIEIEARKADGKVDYSITPTNSGKQQFPSAERHRYTIDHPSPTDGPFFQSRILIREGAAEKGEEKVWQGLTSGVRVYMEGFRVLPYGEPSDDWLAIDATYTNRQKTLKFLSDAGLGEPVDRQEGLLYLRKTAYFGAVFLTLSNAPTLQMLVNREGFIPERGYDNLAQILRIGIDLSVRVRAAAKEQTRGERRKQRQLPAAEDNQSRLSLRQDVEMSVQRASELANEARQLAAIGNIAAAQVRIDQAAAQFSLGSQTSERLMTEGTMLRVLASVGTQMTAFVHEINGILGSAVALEKAVAKLREDTQLSATARSKLGQLQSAIGDLRRSVERQASYLTDVVSPDARRRRSRQKLAERFDAGRRLVEHLAQRRGIKIINEIPPDLKSPPMFMAELTLVFSNLLTNAIKAAGKDGKIYGQARVEEGSIVLCIENTGVAVKPEKGEKWFRPFESTTVETDPVLGQGMGMGLPITRNMLEEYGATIKFVRPSRGYTTALEITFPK
ncbi:MAG: ATP-binding protein [Blastocatellales bacterium]